MGRSFRLGNGFVLENVGIKPSSKRKKGAMKVDGRNRHATKLVNLAAGGDGYFAQSDIKALHEAADEIDCLTAEIERLRAALEKIACLHVTENPLWWQRDARRALGKPSDA